MALRFASRASIVLAIGLIVFATGGRALAQRGGPPGGGFGGGMSLQLLQNEKVQKELELVDDQKDALKKLGEQIRKDMTDQFAGMRDLSREDRTKKFEEMRPAVEAKPKDYQAKIEDVLLPKQKERAKQIEVQVPGTAGYSRE